MKREGRQHGVVRSHAILLTPLSQRRYVKTVGSASVAGLFAKLCRKPTNQSKFTGKCGKARCVGCHINPACKSKDKAKGTMKLRSVGSDPGLIACPAGTSATGALAYLAREGSYDLEDEHEEASNDDDDYRYEYDDDDDANRNVEFGIGIGITSIVTEDEYEDAGEYGDDEWYFVGHIKQ